MEMVRRCVSASLGRAANSSAEVIAEAPSATNRVLPLTDFAAAVFTGATANGAPLGTFSPTQIVMVNGAGQARDTVSALSSGQTFSISWLRSS